MMLYSYILDAEMVFLEFYKLNPIDMMRSMPLMDLPQVMKRIQKNKEKEKKKLSNKDVTAALKAVCDYLNFVFYRDKK